MESFLFHPVQLDKKMNICYHIETQSPPGDIVYHRGVAQLVARVLWEHDAAGSNPVTPTISSVHNRFKLWTLDIFLLMLTFGLNIELF